MAVSTTISQKSYRPGAAMAPEALTGITYTDSAQIVVMRRETDSADYTTAYLDQDYELGGDGANGAGWIRALNAETDSVSFLIQRQTDLFQTREFPPHQPMPARSIERSLDKLTLALQDMHRIIGRALLLPPGEAAIDFPNEIARMSSTIGFNPDGAPIVRTARDEAAFLKLEMMALLGAGYKGDPGGNVMAVGPFDSLNGISVPSGTNYIQTASYATPGSGKRGKGAARYCFVPQPITLPAAGQGKWWDFDATGKRFAIDEVFPTTDHFGGIGDGNSATADTAAIEAAWLYSQVGGNWWSPAGGGSNGTINSAAVVRLGGGNYIYNGPGLVNGAASGSTANLPVVIVGAGKDATRLTITSAVSLVLCKSARSAYVANLEIIGGTGVFYWEGNTGLVTASKPVFIDVSFVGFRDFAIGSDRPDHPGLQVSRCNFNGAPTAGTASASSTTGALFGIAWCGYTDEVTIQDCTVGNVRYDFKFGQNAGNISNLKVSRCAHFDGWDVGGVSYRVANIWCVATDSNVNTGVGCILADSKFGNEGRGIGSEPGTPRYLFAREDMSNPALLPTQRVHSETDTSGYVVRPIIRSNGMFGVSGESGGYVKACIAQFAMHWERTNTLGGSLKPYILQFSDAVIAAGLLSASVPKIIIEATPKTFENVNGQVCKATNYDPATTLFDPMGDALDTAKSVVGGTQGCGYKLLLAAHASTMSLATGGTTAASPIADARGAAGLARTVTINNASTGAIYVGNIAGFDQTKPLHVEIELRQSASNPLPFVQIGLSRTSPPLLGPYEPVELTANWRTVHKVFDFKALSDTGFNLNVQALPASWASGTAQNFDIGTVRVYQCENAHDGRIMGLFDPGDADSTAMAGVTPEHIATITPLTADRTQILSTANRLRGDLVRVSRVDAAAFNYVVRNADGAGTVLATMAAGADAQFKFTGSAFIRVSLGTV